MLDLKQFILFLRESCMIQDPNIVNDTEFLNLEDKQIEDILKIAYSNISTLPSSILSDSTKIAYPLILLAKKEVYFRLATISSPLYDLKSPNGELYKDQRFKHYITLVRQVQDEWSMYQADVKSNPDISDSNYSSTLAKGELFLSSRYYSKRNIQKANVPLITLQVDKQITGGVELSWTINRMNRFGSFKLLICDSPIIDEYNNNSINKNAKEVTTIYDVHINKYRISNLVATKIYHIAVLLVEPNNLIGYDEVQVVVS